MARSFVPVVCAVVTAAGAALVSMTAIAAAPATRPADAAVPSTAPAAAPTTAPVAAQAFASPEAAAAAFVDASRTDDTDSLLRLLGEAGRDVVDSGDPVADAQDRKWFCSAYDQKHTLTPDPDAGADGAVRLVVGEGDWPMPIPVVKFEGGYVFDVAAGRDEILNRRVGGNERATINTLLAVCDAQEEYARTDPAKAGVPAYAARFASRPGRRDGLYWPTDADAPQSPLGALFQDAADDERYADPTTQPTTAPAASGAATGSAAIGPASYLGPTKPYHGYFYRILKGQGPGAPGGAYDYAVNGRLLGGFAVVAWPADYGNSGVMTFLVNQQGTVYQRNLGERTKEAVAAMSVYDPGEGWAPAKPD